jgi:hypothetical protein
VIVHGTPPNFALLAAGAGAFAAVALWRFLVRLRRDRMVGDTPTARLRSAAQGYVKVNGRAQPAGPAPFAAPLTDRQCVWWSYEIAHEEKDDDERSWKVIESAASVDLFALEDEGARCLVGPVRAEITPTAKNVWYGQSDRPAGLPPASAPLLRAGPWRYTEQLIGVGAQLCVMGELRSHSETGDATKAAAAKLHEWKQDQRALLARFDLDYDGRLNATEWEAARLAAQRESQTQALGAQIERVSIISEPVNGEPFLIAPLSGAQMERRERRFAALYFVLGLMGVCACAWALSRV